jgi:hypothetical protein
LFTNGLSHLFTNLLANSKSNKLKKVDDSKGYNHNGHRLHKIFLSIKFGWDFGIFGTKQICEVVKKRIDIFGHLVDCLYSLGLEFATHSVGHMCRKYS